MVITQIARHPDRRRRVLVYVDGIVCCDLSRATAEKSGIATGDTVDDDALAALVAADEHGRANAIVTRMLARRAQSEHDVRRRLSLRRVEPTVVDETVGRLKRLRLIDDGAFAEAWAHTRDRFSPRGRRLISAELRAHGVDAATASVATEDLSDDDAAYRAAAKRGRALASLEYRAFRERLGGYLQRRGFGWETANAAVKRCWREAHGDEELDDLTGGIE